MLTGILSLGYDMSHPLLAGISTSLNPAHRGLAMGMNAFAVFTGYGLGPLLFELLLKRGFSQRSSFFRLLSLSLARCLSLFCGMKILLWKRRTYRDSW